MSPSPRLDSLFQTARRVWSERPELERELGAIESLGYWNWLMQRFADLPALHADLPVPPAELRGRVVGAGSSEQSFHESGMSDGQNLFQCLRDGGFDFTRPSAALDFGCGCGRILRYFARLADTTSLYGADVDAGAVSWCRENLDYARFERLAPAPPTPYADGQFAGVYSFSVFSHLPEDLHLRWLDELQRITAPGAVVVLTIQGRTCVERFLAGDAFDLPFPTSEQLREDLPELDARGILYYPYPAPTASLEAEDAELYGMTYLREEYVRREWGSRFEVAEVREAPQGWQDYVILRRRFKQ